MENEKEILGFINKNKNSRNIYDFKEILRYIRILIEEKDLKEIHAHWWEMEQIVSVADFRKRDITDEEWIKLKKYLEMIEKSTSLDCDQS